MGTVARRWRTYTLAYKVIPYEGRDGEKFTCKRWQLLFRGKAVKTFATKSLALRQLDKWIRPEDEVLILNTKGTLSRVKSGRKK